jgi:hypothetical protein
MRATKLVPSKVWTKHYKQGLLSKQEQVTMYEKEQIDQKNKALDLLDSLTKSGSLVLEDTVLHVIVGSTHVFDETLLNTIIQKNINPIERLERSSMLVASAIYNEPFKNLVSRGSLGQVSVHSPNLLE